MIVEGAERMFRAGPGLRAGGGTGVSARRRRGWTGQGGGR